MMTVNNLASCLTKAEGKKHQASVGDVRELLGILSDMIYIQIGTKCRAEIFTVLYLNGEKRFKKAAKSRRKARK